MHGKRILAVAAFAAVLSAPGMAMDNMTHGHGDAKTDQGAQGGQEMERMGERIFSGKIGPWTAVGRLIDMKAQMEKSGVSAKAIEKLPADHHLMLLLTDPNTRKPASGVTGSVEITGPDKGSSSKVTLVAMGAHIGADVNLPKAGKYTFRVSVEGGGQKGTAVFDYQFKK